MLPKQRFRYGNVLTFFYVFVTGITIPTRAQLYLHFWRIVVERALPVGTGPGRQAGEWLISHCGLPQKAPE